MQLLDAMKRPELIGLKQLKQDGHELVDRIVRTGMRKDVVYVELRARLGCLEGNEHFMQMFTVRDVRKAITILRDMAVNHEGRAAEAKKLKAAHRREAAVARGSVVPVQPTTVSKRANNILPLAEQRRLIAEMRAQSEPVVLSETTAGRAAPALIEPLWRRWLHAIQAW